MTDYLLNIFLSADILAPDLLRLALIIILIISIALNVFFGNSFFRKRNILLKKIVNKRTAELDKKNRKLEKQKQEQNELNLLLEKRQKRIEEQAMNLRKNEEELQQLNELLIKRQKRMEKQAETLKNNEEELEQLNELLEKRQERIEKQAFELTRQRDELKETNATKDKLFSIVAHDLKNPFNTLLGFTELIKSNFDNYNKEKLRELNNTLYETASFIYKFLENLLSWSRSQMGAMKFIPERIELYELAMEIKNLVQPACDKKNIDFVNQIEKNTVIIADRNMIHTVLRNLVTNAVKFTQNGKITINAEKINGSAKITISDTGIGMGPDILDGLFEVNKVKSRKGTGGESGTGLGLIICKEFVQKHKGKIWATSEIGKGSNMFIEIPH